MNMKGLICEKWGEIDDLIYGDLPMPDMDKDQIMIKVKAIGINFPDGLIVKGLYQFKPPFPFCPGGEVSGVVAAIGEEVKDVQVGDHVAAMTGWNGLAQYAVIQAADATVVPKEVPFADAAAMLYTYGTVKHAFDDRAKLKAGEKVAILGAAGGIGMAGIDLATQIGAEVIALASTQEKLDACRQRGAHHTVNYLEQDVKTALKALGGVDVVLDPVGGEASEKAFRCLRWEGRHLVVGFTAGQIPKLPLNLALLKGSSLVGVFFGRFKMEFPDDYKANNVSLIKDLAAGNLKPYIHKTYSFEEAKQAIKDIDNRKAIGKLVVVL